MPKHKYEVIAPRDGQDRPTYWDGQSLLAPGTVVEIDTDVVHVTAASKSLKPVGDSPLFKRTASGDYELVKVEKKPEVK